MRADDLKLTELVDFAEGLLSLHGRRLVLHDLRAIGQFRRDLLLMAGTEPARRILVRFGYFWGQADAAAMQRMFTWDSLEEWLRAGVRLHALEGVTRSQVRRLEVDAATGRFHAEYAWHESGEAAEHVAEFGTSDHPVCWMLVGYASGYASFCLGRPVYFIEQQCQAAGHACCLAEGRDEASWGSALAAYRPYFESEDIQAKVEALTQQLRRKDRELARHRRRLNWLEEGVAVPGFVEIRSPAFRQTIESASRVARFDTSVLITGESGTGKEVLARHIHGLSQRARHAFVAINCGALPETLLEGELFGYRAGAFTGATHDRIGLLESGQQGTVFLDEIGEIPPSTQVKLLRVLQEREVLRLGEDRPRPINVRLIAATNRDLREAVRQGLYREDLFYRLAVVEIAIPPLRERPADILPLARHFVARLAMRLKLPGLRLDASALDSLVRYPWPGNVRELENAMEHAAVFAQDGLITREALPASIAQVASGASAGSSRGLPRSMADVEHEHMLGVLRSVDGNRRRAAAILGISTTTLWRRLRARQSGDAGV